MVSESPGKYLYYNIRKVEAGEMRSGTEMGGGVGAWLERSRILPNSIMGVPPGSDSPQNMICAKQGCSQ